MEKNINFTKINNKREWNKLPNQSALFLQNDAGETFRAVREVSKDKGNESKGMCFLYRIDVREELGGYVDDREFFFQKGFLCSCETRYQVFNLSVE